jgi:uncharacterized protein YdiU (UPF0061 family)
MNVYRPSTVFSSIDSYGRYAYANQPAIVQWNLARFAETLLPLFTEGHEQAVAVATEALNEFPKRFDVYWLAGMRAKLGLETEQAGDLELAQSLLSWMQSVNADFTNTFRDLSAEDAPTGSHYDTLDFQTWLARWKERLRHENRETSLTAAAMRRVNPAVIPRNHRVEEALAAAEDHNDLSVLRGLLTSIANPYDGDPDRELPPEDGCYRTFCGT